VQPGMSARALLEGCRDVDEVRELDFLGHPNRLDRLRGSLRLFAEGFDLVISGGGFFVIREAFFSGAPRRIGLDDGHPLQALNNARIRLDPTRHEAENNLVLIEALGGRAEAAERAPRLGLDPDRTRARAAKLCEQFGVPPDAPVLTVHPGSQKPSRRWPVERFAAVVRLLLTERPDLHVLFTGVRGEESLIEGILLELPEPVRGRAHSTLGLTDLPSLAGLLQRSTAVLCNDTGVMHMARAQGAPLVALLGPENDRLWGPHPLGEAPATALRHVVPCAPCQRWSCESLYCLRLLTVEEVLPEVRQLLDGGTPAGGTPGQPELVRLTRRMQRHTWSSLAAAGLEVPLVSVLVPPGQSESQWKEALAAIEAQDYPRIEIVLPVTDEAAGGLPEGRARLRLVQAEGAAQLSWPALLDTARGAYVTVFAPGAGWKPDRIGTDVAALVRDPQAAWVDAGTSAGAITVSPGVMPPAGTFRREALAAAIAPVEHERGGAAAEPRSAARQPGTTPG
jgi:ADP-heptose:LPS heptosyltransferase